MGTTVHYDEGAPKRARWRVLREVSADPDGVSTRWQAVASFGTEREARACQEGFTIGVAYAPPPMSLDDRLSTALHLVKLARDDYRAEVQRLRAQLRAEATG